MERYADDGPDHDPTEHAVGDAVVEGPIERRDRGVDTDAAEPRRQSDWTSARNSSSRLVASQVKSGSGRPKCP